MNDMISMFIDNEMDMDEKISFIKTVQKDRPFGNTVLDLLRQEKLLRTDVVDRVPEINIKAPFDWRRSVRQFFQPMGLAASALAAVVIFLIFSAPQPVPGPVTNRFVIYRPAVSQVEIDLVIPVVGGDLDFGDTRIGICNADQGQQDQKHEGDNDDGTVFII